MGAENYQALALIMRFVFCAMGAAILAYTVFAHIWDSRNARALRTDENETGYTAFLIQQGRKEEKYPLIREGEVGSARKCDVIIKGGKIEKRHFYYEVSEGGLLVYPLDGKVRRAGKASEGDEDVLALRSGESFSAGNVSFRFMMVKPYAQAVSPANSSARGE